MLNPERKRLIWRVSVISIGAVVLLAGSALVGFRLWQAEWTTQGTTDLQFAQVAVDFAHVADLENSLPFLASAAIDIDGDGRDEVFLGGGKTQADAVLKFDGDKFISVSDKYPFAKEKNDATLGAASLDLEGDGLADLVVARESGVWLHRNSATGLTSEKLPLEIADNTTPLSIAFGDVNRDGWADIYVSGYIKISAVEVT